MKLKTESPHFELDKPFFIYSLLPPAEKHNESFIFPFYRLKSQNELIFALIRVQNLHAKHKMETM